MTGEGEQPSPIRFTESTGRFLKSQQEVMLVRARVPAALLTSLALCGAGCDRVAPPTAPVSGAPTPVRSLAMKAVALPEGAGGMLPATQGVAAGRNNAGPVVTITSPVPSQFFAAIVPPTFTVHWTSTDVDGPGPSPKSYFWRVIHEFDNNYTLTLVNPDSVLRRDAPRFDGWFELDGSVESQLLANLPINARFLFVLTAVDRRGEHDPVLTVTRNILQFEVRPATTGP